METENTPKKNNKLIIMLIVTVAGAVVWLLWPEDSTTIDTPTRADLSGQIEALHIERQAEGFTDTFSETVAVRNISIGNSTSGGGGESYGVFETGSPLVVGRLVGFGTKTSVKGEYLVVYVSVPGTLGYEVDMRSLLRYSLEQPPYLKEDQQVRVYGDFINENTIRARAIQ